MILVRACTTCTRSSVSYPMRISSRRCTRTWVLGTVLISGWFTYVLVIVRCTQADTDGAIDFMGHRARKRGWCSPSRHQTAPHSQTQVLHSALHWKDKVNLCCAPSQHVLMINSLGFWYGPLPSHVMCMQQYEQSVLYDILWVVCTVLQRCLRLVSPLTRVFLSIYASSAVGPKMYSCSVTLVDTLTWLSVNCHNVLACLPCDGVPFRHKLSYCLARYPPSAP